MSCLLDAQLWAMAEKHDAASLDEYSEYSVYVLSETGEPVQDEE